MEFEVFGKETPKLVFEFQDFKIMKKSITLYFKYVFTKVKASVS